MVSAGNHCPIEGRGKNIGENSSLEVGRVRVNNNTGRVSRSVKVPF